MASFTFMLFRHKYNAQHLYISQIPKNVGRILYVSAPLVIIYSLHVGAFTLYIVSPICNHMFVFLSIYQVRVRDRLSKLHESFIQSIRLLIRRFKCF